MNDINLCMVIGQPIAGRDITNINYSNSSAHISKFIADKFYRIVLCDDIIKADDSAAFNFMNTFFAGLTELLLLKYISNKILLKNTGYF